VLRTGFTDARVLLCMRRYHLPPILPTIALIAMPFLPFVNSAGLWLGLPKMVVWGGISALLLSPALLWSGHLMRCARERDLQ
jgi:hypothetical protein